MHLGKSSALGIFFLTAFLLASCSPPPSAPEVVPRLVLIGIDGGSWNLIDPLMAAGELPNLKSLQGRGLSADLTSVQPVNSPTVWTSIATGRSPDAHGVTFFYAGRRSIRVPTLWERFAAAGLRVGLYDYLITWPPRQLPGGFVVPGWLRRDETVWPPDLFDRLTLPRYAYSVGVEGPDAIVASVERELAEKARYWNQMSKELTPDVGAVTFYSIDAVCHRFWHAAYPGDFDPPLAADARFKDVIDRTLRGIDQAVGEIVDALAPEDHVIIASDHGFRAQHGGVLRQWAVHAPWVLANAGIEPARDGVTVISNWLSLALRIDPGPATEREATLRRLADFLATVKTTDGDPLFEVRVVENSPRSASGQPDHPRWMAKMMEKMQPAHAFLFAVPVEKTLESIWPGGLAEADGQQFPVNDVATAHDFSGNHTSTGIFLAAGSAIRQRSDRLRMSVLDVAPLMSYLAGQPIPDDLEGRLVEKLIEQAYLKRYPPRRVAADELPLLPEEAPGSEMGEDSEVNERLRALGYI